mgnify:CR=1 FL=1
MQHAPTDIVLHISSFLEHSARANLLCVNRSLFRTMTIHKALDKDVKRFVGPLVDAVLKNVIALELLGGIELEENRDFSYATFRDVLDVLTRVRRNLLSNAFRKGTYLLEVADLIPSTVYTPMSRIMEWRLLKPEPAARSCTPAPLGTTGKRSRPAKSASAAGPLAHGTAKAPA